MSFSPWALLCLLARGSAGSFAGFANGSSATLSNQSPALRLWGIPGEITQGHPSRHNMTTITTRQHVREAVSRALALHPDREAAIAAVAQALGLDVEAVLECLEQEEQPA